MTAVQALNHLPASLKHVTPKLVQPLDLGLLAHGAAGALALKLVARVLKAVHVL